MTDISVALCTHNGERFLEEQLLSILGQSLLPRQLVLSDDASSDSSVEIALRVIAEFREHNPGVDLQFDLMVNETALGVSKNFEQACLLATGELIALSDQDDLWNLDRLERIAALFAARPALLLVHSDADLIDSDGESLGVTLFEALEVSEEARAQIASGDAFAVLLRRNLVTGATVVIRRSLVALATPFPAGWVHDEWLAIIASGIGEIECRTERMIGYRQHGANEIGVRKAGILHKVRRILEPGLDRNRRLLIRATALLDRLTGGDLDISPARVATARQKLLHEEMRARLSPRRIKRITSITREIRTGRYSQFGRGNFDAIRDLVQPLNDRR